MAKPAEFFIKSKNLDEFKSDIIACNGEFDFAIEDMIALGSAYLERFPDCFSNRSCQDVQLGYQLARICLVEKLLYGFPPDVKDAFRIIFFSAQAVGDKMNDLFQKYSYSELSNMVDTIQKRLEEYHHTIDMLPKGMIKERFVGGITNLFNIAYLIKLNMQQRVNE
ncbi:MAG: hypothetical protein N3F66_03305 [Spirochaetes bacterium]|nr:hypothetical protein [Spirochaetota bacterium]